MKNQNILCCLNENPIFSYRPLTNETNDCFEQIIINYITKGFKGKRWFKKEKSLVENVEFLYYEINLEQALKKIEAGKKYKYNTIEQFCLSFLNYFLDDTPEKLLKFLKEIANFSEEDLKEIELEFNKCKKNKEKKK